MWRDYISPPDYQSVASAMTQASRRVYSVLDAVDRLVDPAVWHSLDNVWDDHTSTCKLLVACRELRTLQQQGICEALDPDEADRVRIAELRLLHALGEVRDAVAGRLYASGGGADWFEALSVHMCAILGVDAYGVRPSPWDEDVLSLLFDFVGESHSAWEPGSAFVHLQLDAAQLEVTSGKESELIEGQFAGFQQSWTKKKKEGSGGGSGRAGLPPLDGSRGKRRGGGSTPLEDVVRGGGSRRRPSR